MVGTKRVRQSQTVERRGRGQARSRAAFGVPTGRAQVASAKKEYLDWKHGPPVACVFARLLAGQPDNFGQHIAVLRHKSAAGLAKAVDTRVGSLIDDPMVVAATLLLAEVEGFELLVGLAAELNEKPGWNVKRWNVDDTPIGAVVAFGITRSIPFNAGTVPSEALVLGPFVKFPATREAPHTALEIFVGVPPGLDPKTKAAPTKANLAHIDIRPSLMNDAVFESMWTRSVSARLKSLDGVDDARAKAKVAFTVPYAEAEALGCLP